MGSYQKLLSLAPGHEDARRRVELAYFSQFQRAIEAYNSAQSSGDAGEFEAAAIDFQGATVIMPDSAGAYVHWAFSLVASRHDTWDSGHRGSTVSRGSSPDGARWGAEPADATHLEAEGPTTLGRADRSAKADHGAGKFCSCARCNIVSGEDRTVHGPFPRPGGRVPQALDQ